MVKKSSKKAVDTEEKKVADQTVNQEEAVETKEKDAPQEEETLQEEQPKAEEEATGDEKIKEINIKLSDINDKYLRLSAEYDNYRKRTLREKMDLTKSAGETILLSLLPVIDDFDRALAHLDEAKDIEAVKEGIKLIYNKFQDFLSQQGIKEIDAKEKEFDTDLHEAITKIPAPADELKGKVIDCVEKGYLLNEKVIRFSKVVIGE
ncbi:nucleotide exchange factor GrpE [Marinilabiliaceae bacterium JC017]|nr:nucleotide exchange factor GrpE [Marinilabiliaceae bacterium JC017]